MAKFSKINRAFRSGTKTASRAGTRSTETFARASRANLSSASRQADSIMSGGLNLSKKEQSATLKKWMGGNLEQGFASEGHSITSGLTSNAIKGAVVGGAVGGTTEAVTGGSFWDGATSGAMTGAIGFTGLKAAKYATGAGSMSPIGSKGIGRSMSNMTNSLTGKRTSKAVDAIVQNNQRAGLATGIINSYKK